MIEPSTKEQGPQFEYTLSLCATGTEKEGTKPSALLLVLEVALIHRESRTKVENLSDCRTSFKDRQEDERSVKSKSQSE